MEISQDKLKTIVNEVLSLTKGDASKLLNESLFLTKHGEEYFSGIRNSFDFVSKGILISFMFDFYSLLPRMFELFSRNDILDPSKLDSHELEVLEILKKTSANPEILAQLNETPFFEQEDIPLLVSSLVFSTYSYCEVFVNGLVDKILKSPVFAWNYIKFVEDKRKAVNPNFKTTDLVQYSVDPRTYATTSAKSLFDQYERGNPFSRQQTLLRVLGLEDRLKGVFNELDEPNYIQKFKDFKELRDSIAHGNPIPELSELKTEEVETKIASLMENMKQEIKADPANSIRKEALPKLDSLISEIRESFAPIIPPISIIQDIIQNAIILPAILERLVVLISAEMDDLSPFGGV